MNKDACNELDVVSSLNTQAYIATANGTGVDTLGFNGITAIVTSGVITDGTFTFKLQDSDDNSSFADVSAAKIIKSFITYDNTKGNTVTRVGYVANRRYVRIVLTATGATTGGIFTGQIVRNFADKKPIP